jgi:hypothetical protein
MDNLSVSILPNLSATLLNLRRTRPPTGLTLSFRPGNPSHTAGKGTRLVVWRLLFELAVVAEVI